MQTIQINDFITPREKPKQKKLLKELYKKFLYKDDTFHYFIEPQLIIRSDNEAIVKEIEQYLRGKKYLVEVYPYPKNKENFRYGETDKAVKKYLKNFLQFFHDISVLYLITAENEGMFIRERVIHCTYNMGFKDNWEEAQLMANYAISRAFACGEFHNKHLYEEKTN